MVPWLDNLPLMTVQRTLHLIHPASRLWGFSLQDVANRDGNIFQYFVWTIQADPGVLEEADEKTRRIIGRSSIVLAFQPPWILSYQDLKEFSDCRSVRHCVSPRANYIIHATYTHSFLLTYYLETPTLHRLRVRTDFGPRYIFQ